MPGAKATGMFVRKPNRNDDKPAMAAVAVTSERLSSAFELIAESRITEEQCTLLANLVFCTLKTERI
jgi:hypothetical protein